MSSPLDKLRKSLDDIPPDKKEAELLLSALRWKENMVVTNDFDERVWLRPLLDKERKRIGITDCCFESDPCERHLRMSKESAPCPT